MDFTQEQIQALETNKHLSVTANAGSGKTFVLVERFKKILKDYDTSSYSSSINEIRIDPTRIIAITFTRKAASEMLAKVVKSFDSELNDLIKNHGITKDTYKQITFLRKIREGMTFAKISTIHSFCSSLLKEYPIESGIPLNFSELNESDKIRMIDRLTESTLEDWFSSDDGESRNKVTDLLRIFQNQKISNIVRIILDKIEIFQNIEEFYLQSDQILLDTIYSYVYDNFVLPAIELSKTLSEMFLNYSPDIFQNIHKTENLYHLSEKVIKISNKDILDKEDIIRIIELFGTQLEIIYTAKGLRVNFMKTLTGDNLNQLQSYDMNFVKSTHKFAKLSIYDDDIQIQQFKITRILLELTKQIIKSIDEEKKLNNALDTNDLQIYANDLLDNTDVVAKIRQKTDFLMIDEFQDTNQLQYDIIKKILPELNGTNVNYDKINLFIVGDAKQSIYGFRNADVRVFQQASRDIVNLNKSLSSKTSDNEGDVNLTTTFRLSPVPASFVNQVCKPLFERDNTGYDVPYIPLICSKDVSLFSKDKLNEIIGDEYGKITFLISYETPKPKKKSADINEESPQEVTNPEEELIAKYIISLVNDEKNNLTFKDITILSRTKTNFNKLSAAFIEYEIPFVIHAGKGFYQSTEIVDILNFLKFIYNPEDDVSLVSILKSAYFDLSDNDIFNIALSDRSGSFWERISKTTSNENIKNAIEILKEILEYSNSMPVSKIIILINVLCGWYGTVNKEKAKQQITANMDKFIQIARDYENKGFKNIYDFVEEISFISKNELLESEAVIISGDDTVNVMTIHASKGLEFPVVILYNAHRESGRSGSFYITPEFGIGFKLPVEIDESTFRNEDTPLYHINNHIKNLAETAEEKRLLYVALTRAKSNIVISGCIKQDKDGILEMPGSYMFDTLSVLSMDIDQILKHSSMRLTDKLTVYNNNQIYDINIAYPVEIINNIDLESKSLRINSEINLDKLILNEEIVSAQNNEMFSPTKLMMFGKDHISYAKKYIFGMPDINTQLYDKKFEGDTEILNTIGSGAGIAIHSVLQNIKNWMNHDGLINNTLLENYINKLFFNNSNNPLKQRIIDECSNIISSVLIQENISAIHNCETEFNLMMPLGDDILNGSIDLLIHDNEKIEIWDWKTNIFDHDKSIEKYAEYYELQMKTYAFFIHRLYPDHNEISARLLFTRLARPNCKNNDWTYLFTWNFDELEKLGEEIQNQIFDIKHQLYGWLAKAD